MKMYLHICIRGNAHQSLFLEKGDIQHLIDLLAVFSYKYDVEVLAYDILSNHIHLLIRSDDPSNFIKALRVSYAHYYNNKYKTEGSVGSRGYVSGIIRDEDQLIEKMIYVIRNSTRHGTVNHPYSDPFNSAAYYYQKERGIDYRKEYQPVEKNTYLPWSREPIPDHFLINRKGHIYPGCFLRIKEVETLLGSYDQAMIKFSNPTEKEKTESEKRSPTHSMKVKYTDLYISQLIMKQIAPRTIPQLSVIEKMELAANIRQKIQVSVRQLSRVLNIPETSLRRWNLLAPKK
ncbi:MAG: transposase [Bacteroidales bacterium]|jgi:REP element-mobilizing transposase RayT/DNA-binding transcriptional regulator YiaG|nr:transposase [Bacteroidales bacterium]MDD2824581.1 transposase [Bacteroidales bacterium]MDD3100732.1 transposase [Bacteroidales bacterium]MDD3639329.1 transposase [Bacteroidales bacterium]MDD3944090.1 transposase [Bacteroidales bacterium]